MLVSDIYGGSWLKAVNIKQAAPVTVTIARIEMATPNENEGRKLALFFQGKDKGLLLNKTNAQMMAHLHGDDTTYWMGKPISLHVEPVQFQGTVVDAIRIKQAPVDAAPPPVNATPAAPAGQPGQDFDDDVPF